MIYVDLLISFLQVGLFSIGGGYAALPFIQDQVVSYRQWLSMDEFTNLITIAEMTPGPFAINSATFVGLRVGGFGGALIATVATIIPSLIIVTILFYGYRKYKGVPILDKILECLRPAVIGLIASAGCSILLHVILHDQTSPVTALSIDWIACVMFFVACIALIKLKRNPILIMILCGILYLLIHVIKTAALL